MKSSRPTTPISLYEDSTLKGYGRRGHGLNGKDADLDYGGQLVVDEAWWLPDGQINIRAHGYASIVPREYPEEGESQEHFDGYMDMACAVVCDNDWSGEWDGDYWVLSHTIVLNLRLDWDDTLSIEANTDIALAAAYDWLTSANADFETDMAALARAVESLSPPEPRRPRGHVGKRARKAAFASYVKRHRAWTTELRS